MINFLEYILESNVSKEAFEIQNQLLELGYVIRDRKSTTPANAIVVDTTENHVSTLKKIAQQIDGIYDPNVSGSSIGIVLKGNVKIIVKPLGKSAETDAEFEQVGIINDFIAQNNGEILLKDNNGKYVRVTSAFKVPGTPKADIALCDGEKEVMWLSHKKGSKASDFQNWGGISPKEISNLNAADVEYINKAIACIKILFTNDNGKRLPLYDVYVENLPYDIQMYAIYGKDFQTGKCGQNNVTFLVQGTIGFKPLQQGKFELTASGHVVKNGQQLTENYIPKIATKSANDRTTYKMKGIRIGIYPLAYHPSAKNAIQELSDKYGVSYGIDPIEWFDQYANDTTINDFYHNTNMLDINDILNYKLK